MLVASLLHGSALLRACHAWICISIEIIRTERCFFLFAYHYPVLGSSQRWVCREWTSAMTFHAAGQQQLMLPKAALVRSADSTLDPCTPVAKLPPSSQMTPDPKTPLASSSSYWSSPPPRPCALPLANGSRISSKRGAGAGAGVGMLRGRGIP